MVTDLTFCGWTVYFDPLFLEQFEELIDAAAKAEAADPVNFGSKRIVKLFVAARKLVLEEIPKNPFDPRYRQGNTLGAEYRHWFRAKFMQQYRIFFRCSEQEHTIIYAWMNDEDTKRAYDSRTDAYRVFRKMLERGRPPDDWATLLREAREATRNWKGDL